jgi:phage protein D
MTEPLYAAVGPVFTVDGTRRGELARDCIRLEITEGVEGLRTLQAHFLAVGAGATGPQDRMLHIGGDTVDFGQELRVAIGPDELQREVFVGAISGVEAVFGDAQPPLAVVLAEDDLMRLRMSRRMRTYRNVTDADIAGELANEHGLQADVGVDGPRYDVVQQLNQSDLAFLRERARLVQAELWSTERTLHFRARPDRQGTALTIVQGNQLLASRFCADLAHQRSTVQVCGYDAQLEAVIDEEAGAQAIEAEVPGGVVGPRLVARALGASATLRVREVALTSAEASAWARAEMLRRSRRFVTATGTTRGSPEMGVGSRVRFELVGAPFDGEGYYVTRVRHTYDLINGLRTHFEAERATLNEVA